MSFCLACQKSRPQLNTRPLGLGMFPPILTVLTRDYRTLYYTPS